MNPIVEMEWYVWCRLSLRFNAFAKVLTWLVVSAGYTAWIGLKNAGKYRYYQQVIHPHRGSCDLGTVNPARKLQVSPNRAEIPRKTRRKIMSMLNDWKSGDSVGVRSSSASSVLPSLPKTFGGVRFRSRLVVGGVIMFVIILIFLLLPSPQKTSGFGSFITDTNGGGNVFSMSSIAFYNKTYPMTAPERTLDGKRFRIGLISDLDEASKYADKDNTWMAYFLRGYLSINSLNDKVSIQLDKEPAILKSQLARGARGMELSELVTFNGKLYSVDDRTGVVYEIIDNSPVPWIILSDGDGKNTKGFKAEWMAVRDQTLFVGGLGKEWTTTSGELVNLNPQWVKAIDHKGGVHHLNWVANYNAMRKEAGFSYPGYMIHESGVWSDVHKRWFFMPRRASPERYAEADDEHRATNLLFSCSANFADVHVNKIGVLNKIRGFSSFKFVPGTSDTVIVALKTEEDRGKIATFYTVFNINGKTLVPETKFANVKYEGIEFI